MNNLTLVLGGARSGKSTLARELILKEKGKKLFIATGEPSDALMEAKIKRHQEERDNTWITIEKYKNFKELKKNNNFNSIDNILIDCITLLVNNQLRDFDIDWNQITSETVEKIYSVEEKIIQSIIELLDICKDKNIFIVSNEVGMGIVPDNMFANYYRDILGRVNQLIAERANTVYFMIAGLPLKIKGENNESF